MDQDSVKGMSEVKSDYQYVISFISLYLWSSIGFTPVMNYDWLLWFWLIVND